MSDLAILALLVLTLGALVGYLTSFIRTDWLRYAVSFILGGIPALIAAEAFRARRAHREIANG